MTTLHIFNPEHDIALAFNRRRLTVPHAAQELRMNLGWIPAIWASDGDAVLVDDVEFARKAARHYRGPMHHVDFVGAEELHSMSLERIEPWGWNLSLRTRLAELGLDPGLMPTEAHLLACRMLSSRSQTTDALVALRDGLDGQTCGEAFLLTSVEHVRMMADSLRNMVVKAPWSSSGRGIRYVVGGDIPASVLGFVKNTLQRQGGIMCEPLYNKVKDLAMEYTAHAGGEVTYEGLSLFETRRAAYTGNLIATEEEKFEVLSKYIPRQLFEEVRQRTVSYFSTLLSGKYVGPFGVDMMIVARQDRQGFLLHPCVEMNLRRTMGHVALAVASQLDDLSAVRRVMSIEHNVNYTLKFYNKP